MSKGWRTAPLSELAEWRSGGTPRKSEPDFWGGDIPWISGSTLTRLDVHDSAKRLTAAGLKSGSRLAQEGSTLILVRGMSLHEEMRIGRASRDVAFNQDVKSLEPGPEIDSWFLTYSLMAHRPELLDMVHAAGHGTGVLATDRIQALHVNLPPLPEQRAIVSVLRSLDELADASEALAVSCNDLWRTIVRRELHLATAKIKLSDAADFINGKNFTRNATGGGRPVIRTPELRRGPASTTVYNEVETPAKHIAACGDILFVWSGSLMVDRWEHDDGLVNQHIFKVLPKRDVPSWLAMALIEYKMPAFLGLAADQATTMGHIQRRHLDSEVPALPARRVRELDRLVSPLYSMALKSRIDATRLRKQRDDLLPLIISGLVRPRGRRA